MIKRCVMAVLFCLFAGTTLAAESTALVKGVLHAVDVQKRILNIDHPAVPEFQWPPMRMDFSVAKGVKLEGLTASQTIRFTLTKSDKGEFTITSIEQAR
ncbi:MAG: copper-binding protein [Magnetococcus sp. MYC-9]